MFWFPLPSPSFSFFPSSSSFLDLDLNLNLNYLNYLNLNLLNLLNHSDWVMKWRLKWLPLSFVSLSFVFVSLSLSWSLSLSLFSLSFSFFLIKMRRAHQEKLKKFYFSNWVQSLSQIDVVVFFSFCLLFPNSVISTLSSCCFWVPWLLYCSQFHWSWVLTLNSFSFSFSSFSFSFASSSSFSSSSSSFSFWTFQKEFGTRAWNLKISIESHLKK